MTDPYGNPPVVLSPWAETEMRRQQLVPYDAQLLAAFDFRFYAGYFCTASGCLEDRTDSHGECVNCGEPVVHVINVPKELL